MKPDTQPLQIAGPAGALQCSIDLPPAGTPLRGNLLLCHPHPLHGGSMDNKVVITLARAFLQLGYRVLRFNFRGAGGSAGAWDEGRGEIDDALACVQYLRQTYPGLPLALGGFSFGGYVAAQVADRLAGSDPVQRLVLVGPAVSRFALPPRVAADTLVIHGEADEVVPLSATLDWARPQVLPVIVLPGVGHFFHGQLGLLKAQVLQAWQA